MTELPKATFDADDLRRSIVAALAALRAHQAAIDEANVFPVPDGDTGTNMVLTLTAAAGALNDADPFTAVPEGALVGARGNSGVVLSQILRGLISRAKDGGAEGIKAGLAEATELAYAAVLEPVEGTILSVMRGASTHATGDTPAEVFDSASRAARVALEATPGQLPILADAGVLDAGGLGLWVVLDAMAAALTGRAPAEPPAQSTTPLVRPRESGSTQFAFEVQYLLEAPPDRIDTLRAQLGEIGDSVMVSGGGGLWNVHVHTNDSERAISLGSDAGSVRSPAITRFADQISGSRTVPVSRAGQPVSVVAVVAGDGFARLYAELGAGVIVDGGPTMNPSVGDIASAIDRAPSRDVIVLPNNDDAIPAARQACERAGARRAIVVDTHDLAHGITTMLAFGDARDLDRNVAQMRQAASVAATASVVVAVRDARTPRGPVRAGQALGRIGREIALIEDDPIEAVLALAKALDAESPIEVLTLFAGATAPAAETAELEKRLLDELVGVDVEVRDGGQPVERYLLAVE